MTWILFLIQMAVTVVVGCYFWSQLKQERQAQPGLRREASREMEHLRKMRTVHLSEPLSEHVRPQSFEDIIGQQEGIKSLKAILCGANPQHVIIYGPPGIGKTCAARLVLEYAKHSPGTPFKENAPFIEMDATCVRFDERSIADPLFGSVHDPIYQGAVMEIEAVTMPGSGHVTVRGIVDEEEMGDSAHCMKRRSTARVSADNVETVLRMQGYLPADRDVHVNFPGGAPVDGPSAGVAMAVAAVSALTGRPVDGGCALTGEISVQGQIKPVGGVPEKVEAARRAGLIRAYVPRENMQERFEDCGIDVRAIDTLAQALERVLLPAALSETEAEKQPARIAPLAAQGTSGEASCNG